MDYDEGYFKYGVLTGKSAYSDYRWLPERTHREVRALINALDIEPLNTVLDFGCAMGYWVKALRHYNIEAYGIDTSKYALENVDPEVKLFITDELKGNYDFIVSRNTFEHLTEEDLKETLIKLKEHTDTVFFTVPLCEVNGGEYIIPIAEMDKTHKIRWTKVNWFSFCTMCGWENITYSPTVKGIHDKWEQFKDGTGFFLLKK